MNDAPKSPEPIADEFRVRRSGRHVQPVPNVPMRELETHYKRLCRVNEENLWKKGFGLLAVVLLGGVLGAALAGPGWTWEVKAATLLAVLAALGWKGMAETESEGIKAIRDDYKEDILDSFVFEPVGGTPSTNSTSEDDHEPQRTFDQEIEEAVAELLAARQNDSKQSA